MADKDVILVDGYCTFGAKIGDSPKEKTTVCTFPLGSADPVLGLRWFKKRNPRTDWKTLTFYLNRNGRRYMLWPVRLKELVGGPSPLRFKHV